MSCADSRRLRPYTIIAIPQLNKQIAVCDQIGEQCFVATGIRPSSFWAATGKLALKADPAIDNVRYDVGGDWLSRLRDILLGEGVPALDASRFPKTATPRAAKNPLLTAGQLCRWIEIFHELEGRYPSALDRIPVRDRDVAGRIFIVAREGWNAIDQALDNGARRVTGIDATSLYDFKRRHGYEPRLTTGMLCRWIEIFHELEHRYPYSSDRHIPVRERDGEGRIVIIEGRSWFGIDKSLQNRTRSVTGIDATGLADFKHRHGYLKKQRSGPRPKPIASTVSV